MNECLENEYVEGTDLDQILSGFVSKIAKATTDFVLEEADE